MATLNLNPPLCRLCECPAVDSFVQVSNVVNEAFNEWCLETLGHELASELQPEDLICCFCVWDAELLSSHEGNINGRWWPSKEEKDEQLKKFYFSESAMPCSVVMKKTTDEEIFSASGYRRCIYCDEFLAGDNELIEHVEGKHKGVAIRCDLYSHCVKYFHSFGERKKHRQSAHANCLQNIWNCVYCGKTLRGDSNYRQHVNRAHSKIKIKCMVIKCLSYFKTLADAATHMNVTHPNYDFVMCDFCNYQCKATNNMSNHITSSHLEKTIGCRKCPEKFSHRFLLQKHMNWDHVSVACTVCKMDISRRRIKTHEITVHCKSCKKRFGCSTMLQNHFNECKSRIFKCTQCDKSFAKRSLLEYHTNSRHKKSEKCWRGIQYQDKGIKCTPCKLYFRYQSGLKGHRQSVHGEGQSTLKVYCEHCPAEFKFSRDLINLKNHLACVHGLIEKRYKCHQCEKKFFLKSARIWHNKVHAGSSPQNHISCRFCGKQTKPMNMPTHMLRVHGVSE